MARDISELGADVFDDSPKEEHKISPKKRNYIIGLSIASALFAGAVAGTVIACNTVLLDYSNLANVTYYYAPKNLLGPGEEPTAVLYKLKSNKKYKSTFRIPNKVQGYKVVGVADKAFVGHSEIKKVIMPKTLKFVGEEAFKDCTSLSKFTWSKSLDDVGLDAFANTAFYNKLLSQPDSYYNLPSGTLIYVGKNKFKDNTALVSDEISESEVNAAKTKYNAEHVVKFSELGANNIAAGVFKNNERLCYVDLPDRLNSISKYMFEGCKNLKGIEGKHSQMTQILYRAFADCTSLVDIDLPSGLETLGDQAFSNTALVDTIPDISTVKNLGERIFENCKQLKSVTYNGTYLPNYTFNGCESLETIQWGSGNANIDKVNYFGVGAFKSTKFSSFVIPKNVTTIYDETFKDCTSLAKVSMWQNASEQTVSTVYLDVASATIKMTDNSGDKFFSPKTVTVTATSSDASGITWSSDNEYIATVSTKSTSSGEEIVVTPVDEGTAIISASATIGGEVYTSSFDITISSNENTTPMVVGEDLPHYISGTGVEKVGELRGVNVIRNGSFSGCTSLSTIDLYDDNYNHAKGLDNEFTFPLSLKETQGSAISTGGVSSTFAGSTTTRVHITPNVKTIGSYAFDKSVNLEEVIVDNPAISSLHTIGEDAFLDCTSLREFDLPATIGTNEDTYGISPSAFKGCVNLEHVGLGDTSINSIQSYVFYDCQKLEELDIPSTVNQVKDNAFYQNYLLNYLIIPEKVTNINASAFMKARETPGDTMPLYFDMTLTQAKNINYPERLFEDYTDAQGKVHKQTWHDDTVELYFKLGPGEEKQTGYKYWNGDHTSPAEI